MQTISLLADVLNLGVNLEKVRRFSEKKEGSYGWPIETRGTEIVGGLLIVPLQAGRSRVQFPMV